MDAPVTLDTDHLEDLAVEETVEQIVRDGGLVDILVPLSSVGSAQDPYDIAIDYVHAILVSEQIAELSTEVGYRQETHGHRILLKFTARLKNPRAAVPELRELLNRFFNDVDEGVIDEGSDLYDQLFDQNPEKALRFPALADSYLANLLHGSACWEEPGSRRDYFKRFPELRYGYWRSFLSPHLGYDLYVSTHAWFAPPAADVTKALIEFGFWEPRSSIDFEAARLVRIDRNPPLLLHRQQAVKAPFNAVRSASRFAARLNPFQVNELKMHAEWHLSACGDVALYKTSLGQAVAFCDARPPGSKLASDYLDGCEQITQLLRTQLGIAIHTPCDWSRLDDEKFEELCYDVARRFSLFDASSVRKMGKSRSRDGGRDIVATTRSLPGQTPRKWIIQCKLITSGRSLGASAVNVSDTIDQFGADGYMVMTNAVIDSTLYDRLEAIGKRRQIEQQPWSGLELERFLQGHRDLLSRYF